MQENLAQIKGENVVRNEQTGTNSKGERIKRIKEPYFQIKKLKQTEKKIVLKQKSLIFRDLEKHL